MRPVLQTEVTECGLASMVMVAQFHGHKIDLNVMRQCFGLSLKGAVLRNLMNMADDLGFGTRALRLEPEHLKDIPLPVILHWDLNHFVVLKEVKRRKFIVLDSAHGRIELSATEFSDHFTGTALEVVPSVGFTPIDARQKNESEQLADPTYGFQALVNSDPRFVRGYTALCLGLSLLLTTSDR